MRRVNATTKTPVPATILIVVIGVVLMLALPGHALLQLILGGTILPALIYGAIVGAGGFGGWGAATSQFGNACHQNGPSAPRASPRTASSARA